MRSTVRFLLDNEIIELSDVDPTRTVLQYLRDDLRRTGTKEGCAEGDCGACMVAVCELTDDGCGLRYRAINSCIQFLATLDGKELITVESLSPPDGPLHPVQQAMVDCHGSQCGFCTPGFVMTLFAMYKNPRLTSRADTDDALAGNLCRCTGYRPIIDAAATMYDYDAPGQSRLAIPFSGPGARPDDLEQAVIRTLQELQQDDALHTDCDGRQFFAPRDLGQLSTLIAAHPEACILAGGTDVGLWVTKQYRDLDTVIYLANVAALHMINETDADIEIGAAVTFSDAMPVIGAHYPALNDLLRRFASPPIRNAATLGGNIANGSPIGDSMPALIALGSEVVLRRGGTERTLALEALYHDYQVNDLKPGEFVARVRIPKPCAGQVVRSYKLSKRFDQDISAVCAAFSVVIDNGQISDIRIACGGVAGTPKRAVASERTLLGQPFEEAPIRRAMQALEEDYSPLSDMRASADYRMTATQHLLYRFFLDASGSSVATDVYNYGR